MVAIFNLPHVGIVHVAMSLDATLLIGMPPPDRQRTDDNKSTGIPQLEKCI